MEVGNRDLFWLRFRGFLFFFLVNCSSADVRRSRRFLAIFFKTITTNDDDYGVLSFASQSNFGLDLTRRTETWRRWIGFHYAEWNRTIRFFFLGEGSRANYNPQMEAISIVTLVVWFFFRHSAVRNDIVRSLDLHVTPKIKYDPQSPRVVDKSGVFFLQMYKKKKPTPFAKKKTNERTSASICMRPKMTQKKRRSAVGFLRGVFFPFGRFCHHFL